MLRAGVFVLLLGMPVAAQVKVRLAPQTQEAFDQYIATAEAGMDFEARFTAQSKPGEVRVAPWGRDGVFDAPDGMIHDWAASAVAPRATAEKILSVLQNYAAYKIVYAPEVVESHMASRDGNHWHPHLKLVKRKALMIALNTDYDVEYRALKGGRWAVISHSTRIAELDGKNELEPGYDHGFLWRLNAYWLIEPRPEGVYLECRTISLTRDLPPGLGWMLRPMVSTLPRESLQKTLEATLRAVH